MRMMVTTTTTTTRRRELLVPLRLRPVHLLLVQMERGEQHGLYGWEQPSR